MQRYRLARKSDSIPMPERGRAALFPAEAEGASVNELDPYYARLISEGALIAVPEEEPAPAKPKPEGGKA